MTTMMMRFKDLCTVNLDEEKDDDDNFLPRQCLSVFNLCAVSEFMVPLAYATLIKYASGPNATGG